MPTTKDSTLCRPQSLLTAIALIGSLLPLFARADTTAYQDAIALAEDGQYELARQRMENAAAEGDASAQRTLGLWLLHGATHGMGGPQDYAGAELWLRRAAAQGDSVGRYYADRLDAALLARTAMTNR